MRIEYEIDFNVNQLNKILKHLKISESVVLDYVISLYHTIYTVKLLYKGNKTYWNMIVRENCNDLDLTIKNLRYLTSGE